jgi:hypothetical protein
MKTFRNSIILAGILALNGCAPIISGAMNASTTEADVVNKTVAYFGAKPDEIQISNIEKHALDTTYKAVYRGVLYNCSIYYGAVNCKQPGT